MKNDVSVDGVLGPHGALSAALEGYEHRPEQLTMARAVDWALQHKSYLLAEAGTGTGKTLAYLVPAVLSGRRVVVSTATKTLQEQVFFKDIPLLQKKVGLKFEATYLKGRSNYLCAYRYEAFEKQPLFATVDEAERWSELQNWALSTKTGDRAELDLPDVFLTWSKLSTTSDSCLGAQCPLYENCFVTQARRKAEDSQLVVVNHHLFFADLALKGRGGDVSDASVLPFYDAVVFDEAHALEDVVTEFFGMQVSSHRLEDLVADALEAIESKDGRSGALSAMALAVRGKAESFFSEAQRGFRLLPGDSVRLRADMLAPLQKQSRELVEALATLASMSAQEEEPRLASLCRRASELSADLDFIRQAEDTTHVFWAEARKGVFFKAAPIDVAETLRKKLYSHLDTVVFTSATLTTSGKFQYFGRRMGLDVYAEEGNDVRAVSVPSPFDYASQAALYVPTHMPRPNQPEFSEACAEEVLQLVQVTQGRAFVLFTSLKQMETVHRLLEHRLEFQVLLQGQAPKRTLLAKFQEAPSVLFASHSFWEGVDVPGDALSLVVMDKLPFASPGDPLVAARVDALMAQGDNAFEMYQLPQAIISLRQGFGRLIRTRKDFGIVAVLDSRLRTHGYGRAFLNSLPPASRLNSIDDLNVWFSAATSHPVAREKNKTP